MRHKHTYEHTHKQSIVLILIPREKGNATQTYVRTYAQTVHRAYTHT